MGPAVGAGGGWVLAGDQPSDLGCSVELTIGCSYDFWGSESADVRFTTLVSDFQMRY